MKALKTLLSLGVALAMGSAFAQAEDAAKPVNSVCPVSGEDIDAEQTSGYTKVVGFCCDKCLTKFNKGASAHIAKIAEVPSGKVVNAKCPVSGEDIDPEQTAAYNGATVGLCCEKCQAKFEKDPSKFAEKIAYVTAANDKCPFSGEDIDKEQVAAFTATVAFCCEKCKGKFDKDPDKLIGKVEFDSAEKE